MKIERKPDLYNICTSVTAETLEAINMWRRSNPGYVVTRQEALRQLIALGLSVDARPQIK